MELTLDSEKISESITKSAVIFNRTLKLCKKFSAHYHKRAFSLPAIKDAQSFDN